MVGTSSQLRCDRPTWCIVLGDVGLVSCSWAILCIPSSSASRRLCHSRECCHDHGRGPLILVVCNNFVLVPLHPILVLVVSAPVANAVVIMVVVCGLPLMLVVCISTQTYHHRGASFRMMWAWCRVPGPSSASFVLLSSSLPQSRMLS